MAGRTGAQPLPPIRRYLGDTTSGDTATNPLALTADATANHLILNSGITSLHYNNRFNGWLDGDRLISLRPRGYAHREAAETW
jgi:hypothetical protein